MDAVDYAVIDFHGHSECLTTVLGDDLSPGDSWNHIIDIQITFMGTSGKVKPRKTGDIDQLVAFFGLVNKRRLCMAFFFCNTAEFLHGLLTADSDNIELFIVFFYVCKAWNPCF